MYLQKNVLKNYIYSLYRIHYQEYPNVSKYLEYLYIVLSDIHLHYRLYNYPNIGKNIHVKIPI
jgi:hypothetical protein